MESYAEMTCVLKVKIHCEICKRKVMQVLQNLHGLYSFVIDAEKRTVEVAGRVNPEMILRVLGKYGKHAEITCLRFDGDVQENHYYSYGENGYMPPGVAYPYPMLGPEYQYYDRCPTFISPPPPLLPPLPPWRSLPQVSNCKQVVPPAPPSEEPESCSIM